MKHVLLLCTFLSLSTKVYSQRMMVRAGAGYALPLSNSRPVYMTGFPYTGGTANPNEDAMFEVKKASMFSGPRATVGAGMMFFKAGFEIAATTVLGKVSHSVSNSLGGVYAVGSKTTITQSTQNPTMLMPSAVLNVPGKKVDILVRAGMVFPLNSKLFVESETIDGANKFYDKSEVKTHFGFGFTFSGGAEYKITKKLRAYASIDIVTMNLKAKEQKLVESTINGNDVLESKFAFEKRTIYVESLEGYTFSSNESRKQQTYSIPFGTKGFSLGVSISL